MVQLQGLQNPIVLHSGSAPVVDEICADGSPPARPPTPAAGRQDPSDSQLGVLGKAQQLFGDDVLEYLGRSAADGQGPGEQIAPTRTQAQQSEGRPPPSHPGPVP